MFLNLITVLFLCSFVFAPTGFAEEVKVKNELSDAEYFKQFYDVFERVNRDYVQEPEKQKMTDAAINGMLNSLDPHSSYITDDDLRDFLINTQGEFGGIGVEIMYDHGAIKVISPIDDLPAYKAGIKAGDYLVGVNDQLVSTLGFNKAVNAMRGEPGTKVKLLVIQEGEPKPKEIELTREVVTIKAVKANLEKNNVAYVRITTFNENTIVELKKAISNLNGYFGNKGVPFNGNQEYIMLRKDFEIEYYFPDEWLNAIHDEHPGWFQNFTIDVDRNLSFLEIKDNSKGSFQKEIFRRIEDSQDIKWLEKWIPVLSTIESSLVKQKEKIGSN